MQSIDYRQREQTVSSSQPSRFLCWFYILTVDAEYWMQSKALMVPAPLARGLRFLIVSSATAALLLGSLLENLVRVTEHNLAFPFKPDMREIYWASPLRKGEVTPLPLAGAALLYSFLIVFLVFYEAAILPVTFIVVTVCTVSRARRMWSVNLLICELAESQVRWVR